MLNLLFLGKIFENINGLQLQKVLSGMDDLEPFQSDLGLGMKWRLHLFLLWMNFNKVWRGASFLTLLKTSVVYSIIDHSILLDCLQGLGIEAQFCNGSTKVFSVEFLGGIGQVLANLSVGCPRACVSSHFV